MKNNAAAGVFLYFTQQTDKLEFGPQGGLPSRALDMCNRSFPDPLGFAVWFDKLEFDGPSEPVIANQ